MALYLFVMATAILVSLMALASAAVVRVERRQNREVRERLIARSHAHSAVELGLRVLKTNASWRTTYANGTATTPLNLESASATGTVSWIYSDTDGSLTDADTHLRIKGVGRIGNAVQAASVQLTPGPVGPGLLRSLTGSGSTDAVQSDKWWGQYFRPTLPADAHRWWVSSVEIYVRRITGARTIRVRLYKPNGSNMPSAQITDEVSLNSNDVLAAWDWKTISFSGVYSLAATDGLCLGVETTAGGIPIEIAYVGSGVSQTHSALLRGSPSWTSYETNKALLYRVNGYYTTNSGVTRALGSWQWDTP